MVIDYSISVTNIASPSLSRSLDLLYKRNPHTIKLDLGPVRALLKALGNPHEKYVCIHVAGTNGKGSVSAMLASILRAAGFRTGLYTSPHLIRFNERVVVDGEPIGDADLESLLGEIDEKAKSLDQRDVTFFEFTTALAFEYFRRREVDLAVLETGMGGRLDATNVVIPAVSVITSISLDHQQYLGDTIEKIAAEKAGIIKAGRPVVCGALLEEARASVERVALERGVELIYAADVVSVRRVKQDWSGQRVKIETQDAAFKPITLPFFGGHQLGNCAVAVATIGALGRSSNDWTFGPEIFQSLERMVWPARFQILSKEPPVILDGAHNPEAARALAQTLGEVAGKKDMALVVGFLSDKDARGILRPLARRAKKCWVVQLHNERGMPIAEAMTAARSLGLDPVAVPVAQAVQDAKNWASEHDGIVCITGSLYLAGEVLQL
ncbi:MAG: folylpolyglutamate synthase/dihydrofolate synthase family protein [bacterium]